MKSFCFFLLVFSPFFQGCGISGVYIYFGDQAMQKYKKAVKNHKTEEAQDFIKRAFENYQSSLTYDERRYPMVYSKLADASWEMSKKAYNSVEWIKRGLNISPDLPDLLAEAGRYTFLQGVQEEKNEKIQEAKDFYRAALLKDPLEPRYNAGLMKIFFWEIEKNIMEANEARNPYLFTQIQDLLENVDDATSSPYVVEAKGVLSFLQGDYKQAIENLTSVLQMEQDGFDNQKTQFYLCRSFVETKRYDDAIEIATRMLEKNPEDIQFLGERILANYLKGETSAGAIDLELMEKLDQTYHEFYYRLGVLFTSRNWEGKAEIVLLRAYRLNPKNPNYAYALGQNYVLKGDRVAAKNFFEKARMAAPPKSEMEKLASERLAKLEE